MAPLPPLTRNPEKEGSVPEANPTTWRVLTGRVEEHLPAFEPESFDCAFCDPPYGLTANKRGGSGAASLNLDSPAGRSRISTGGSGFMGKEWDARVPGPEIWREVLRCLKPGAFLLAFGGTRTYHRLACAIEDAGFEIRDCAVWLHGQGFPKSLDISAAIDKTAGVEREVVGRRRQSNGFVPLAQGGGGWSAGEVTITAPATEAASTWEGYGTALKPAWEPCIVAMKPLSGTFAANALRHGVAGLNVDGCRIESGADHEAKCASVVGLESNRNGTAYGEWTGAREDSFSPLGRWPANVILDEDSAAALDQQSGDLAAGNHPANRQGIGFTAAGGGTNSGTNGDRRSTETGGASRFFYTSKVRPEERNLGGIDCRHPTLKPIDLCEYLARLILPPKRPDAPRRLLVPFAGAGSEMIGALEAGWEDVTGIELEEQSAEWARARISAALSLNPAERRGERNEKGEVLQPGLFG